LKKINFFTQTSLDPLFKNSPALSTVSIGGDLTDFLPFLPSFKLLHTRGFNGKILNRPKKLIATCTKVLPNMFCPHSFPFMLPFSSSKPSPNDILYGTWICYAHFVTYDDAIHILTECMQTTCHGISFPPIRVYIL
jgi:hypothetical protein